MASLPRALLRLEGLCVAALCLAGALVVGAPWWAPLAFFLVPDLGMLGYLAGPRVGSWAYDATHTLLGPVLLGALGVALPFPLAALLGLLWGFHIGVDRALGDGLKYATGFRDTDLQRV
jgi:hypothetical protein